MSIYEIIAKYYPKFYSQCMNTDKAVYDGKTSQDILGDCVITTIKKFGNLDISEIEGYEYFKKTFLMEELFAHKRKGKEKILYVDNLITYDKRAE